MDIKINDENGVLIGAEITEDSLFLSNKGLSKFPENLLSQCQNVKYCYLESNSLSNLPESFFRVMPCLQWLDLRNNNLEKIPTEGLSDHPSLQTLLLQNNRLKSLPHQLAFVPHLKGLQVAGNPIENVPFEIIASGFLKLLRYLRNVSYEQKVLLPVSETIITNPSQKEVTGDLDRSIKPINAEYRRKMSRIEENVSAVLNVKSYHGGDNVESTFIKEPLSKTKKALGAVKACTKVTYACKTMHRRCKTGISKTNLLVTHEKIQAEADRLRKRARLKETIIKQSQMLQRLKDVETVKKWRDTSKKRGDTELLDNHQISPSKITTVTPFDLDRDMMKMLSRKDIYMSLKEWEQKKRREANQHTKCPENKIRNIEDQIGELSEQLIQLDLDIQRDLESSKKKIILSSRIHQINKLRRTLRNLHGKNMNVP